MRPTMLPPLLGVPVKVAGTSTVRFLTVVLN